jgi:4-aminobutyrate aminotransferase-like enzyme
VLRIKPPLCITAEDVDFALDVLDRALARVV